MHFFCILEKRQVIKMMFKYEPKTYLRVFMLKLSDVRLWAKVNERLSLHVPYETISDISQYADDELSEMLQDSIHKLKEALPPPTRTNVLDF